MNFEYYLGLFLGGLTRGSIYALLALESSEKQTRLNAANYFAPCLLLILVGEILAAGLTAGHMGLAF